MVEATQQISVTVFTYEAFPSLLCSSIDPKYSFLLIVVGTQVGRYSATARREALKVLKLKMEQSVHEGN